MTHSDAWAKDDQYAAQMQQDDWYRYQMERDDALERRHHLIVQARKLHRVGIKVSRFLPEIASVNIAVAAEYRAEARRVRHEWR